MINLEQHIGGYNIKQSFCLMILSLKSQFSYFTFCTLHSLQCSNSASTNAVLLIVQFIGTFWIQGVLYGSVGFGCGLIGQGIANMIMNAKRYGLITCSYCWLAYISFSEHSCHVDLVLIQMLQLVLLMEVFVNYQEHKEIGRRYTCATSLWKCCSLGYVCIFHPDLNFLPLHTFETIFYALRFLLVTLHRKRLDSLIYPPIHTSTLVAYQGKRQSFPSRDAPLSQYTPLPLQKNREQYMTKNLSL